MRQPGGPPSRNIDYLRFSLTDPDPADEAAKLGAVIELARLVSVAIDQATKGDDECGYLLAELLAYLSKNRSRLSEKNETFQRCYSTWESSRPATRRGSPLRPLVHAVPAEAQRNWRL